MARRTISPSDPERRAAARAQLIQILAERLVRDALTTPQAPDARSPLRPIQHRQAARELD